LSEQATNSCGRLLAVQPGISGWSDGDAEAGLILPQLVGFKPEIGRLQKMPVSISGPRLQGIQ